MNIPTVGEVLTTSSVSGIVREVAQNGAHAVRVMIETSDGLTVWRSVKIERAS